MGFVSSPPPQQTSQTQVVIPLTTSPPPSSFPAAQTPYPPSPIVSTTTEVPPLMIAIVENFLQIPSTDTVVIPVEEPVEEPAPVGERRSMHIGLNYIGTSARLNGCENDCELISKRLNDIGNFTPELVFDQQMRQRVTMTEWITRFVNRAKSGDVLVFHYSGHGTYVTDYNGDEVDGRDEALVTTHLGVVTDDQLYDIFSKLPSGVKLFVIIDACHSGTALDLPYIWGRDHINLNRNYNADIVMISGCKDDEYSQESVIYESGRKTYGALSHAFAGIYIGSRGKTWIDIVTSVRKTLLRKGFKQYPVLSASSPDLFGQVNFISK